MFDVIPTGGRLGATIDGVDLNGPLTDPQFGAILRALGRYGVLRFPDQSLEPDRQRLFSARFGSLETNIPGAFQEPGQPGVMILSNIIGPNGKPIGARDAGQDWHTDLSFCETVAFANVLYALRVPCRDGRALGGTEFANMYAAYEGLSNDLKALLDDMTVLHDFNSFWQRLVNKPGSWRQPLTEQQRKLKPPVSHPIFLTHPVTGRKVLYANPGYATRINELPETESDEILQFLFGHQLRPEYRFVHRWTVGDVLLWDDLATLHTAHGDYLPSEHRLIRRCQVLADRIFDPRFVRSVLAS